MYIVLENTCREGEFGKLKFKAFVKKVYDSQKKVDKFIKREGEFLDYEIVETEVE